MALTLRGRSSDDVDSVKTRTTVGLRMAARAGRLFFALALHPPSRAASERGDQPKYNLELQYPVGSVQSASTRCTSSNIRRAAGRRPLSCERSHCTEKLP